MPRFRKVTAEREPEEPPKQFKAPDLITSDNVTYTEIALEDIVPNDWNPNVLDAPEQVRLHNSLDKFGQVENLVVRQMGDKYELIGGEHRWKQLKKQKKKKAICAVVNLSEEDAMLLSEVLNNLHGKPDLDKHSEFYKRLTQSIDVEQIIRFVPSTEEEIKNIIDKITADSTQAGGGVASSGGDPGETLTLKFTVTKLQAEVISQAFDTLAKREGISNISSKTTKGYCLEMICADFLSGADQ